MRRSSTALNPAAIASAADGDQRIGVCLIAEIEFRAWTGDDRLRHASCKGLQERQDNADVYKLD
ncbi:hypothetical protein KP800_20130 [Agrobacterium pusense]|nr:hypothetical protein BA939_19560 [Rhizobium sp. S41]QWW77482.1 hypothetical protein KP800_20130 [Agrobacterium pusense]